MEDRDRYLELLDAEPQDADLREQLTRFYDKRWHQQYDQTSRRWLLTMTDRLDFIAWAAEFIEAAGYRRCPKMEWPRVSCGLKNQHDAEYYCEGARAQWYADMKRCPAQQEGKP